MKVYIYILDTESKLEAVRGEEIGRLGKISERIKRKKINKTKQKYLILIDKLQHGDYQRKRESEGR